MLNERELIGRLEAADADELATMLARPASDEERVLRLYLGNRTYQRLHGLALRRALERTGSAKPSGRNVVIVPGIFGCELSSFDRRGTKERIWLSARSIAAGRFAQLRLDSAGRSELDPNYAITATGIMKRDYGELILTLAEQWNVHVFWYDWRKDLRIAAAQLQALVNSWFAEHETVHFIGHAEGGLVVRSYIAQYQESWRAQKHGKLIMLGTPNYGIYSAIQALTGQLEMVQWLDLLDSLHNEVDIRSVVQSFPSLYELLPAPLPWLNSGLDALYQCDTYPSNANISADHLTSAREHHLLLQKKAFDPQRMIYVGGDGQPTLVGVDIPKLRDPQITDLSQVYKIGLSGDGRVAHRLGILRDQNGKTVPTYLLKDASFGELHTQRAVLDALDDLLTLDLSKEDWREAAPRLGLEPWQEEEPREEAPENYWREAKKARLDRITNFENLMRRTPIRSLPDDKQSAYTIEDSALEENLVRHFVSAQDDLGDRLFNRLVRFDLPKLKISVVYGDIAQLDKLAPTTPPIDAMSVGYYSGGRPESAMLAIDREISRAVSRGTEPKEEERILYQFTQRGTIQGQLAQTYLLNDPRKLGKELDRIIAIAGMGPPGRFGAPELTVLARELCWTVGRLGKQHLATTLIGAGVGNLSLNDAVVAWLRGVKFALTGINLKRAPALAALTFVEYDPTKVLEIYTALKREREGYQKDKRMMIELSPLDEEELKEKIIPRWQAEQRRWLAASTERAADEIAATRITVGLDGSTYRFGAITNDASIPEREIPLDPDLVNRANDELAAEVDPDQQVLLGQFMERLLIPADLRPSLTGGAPIVMMMDATTARVHWELMGQTTSGTTGDAVEEDAHRNFWATSRGFTRQLRTVFAPPPEPPPPNNRLLRVLVVADPAADARLAGAEEEGILVADLFESFNLVHKESLNRIEVVRLFGPNEATRTAVLRQVMMRTYDVLHFAGHCTYDEQDPANSGWIFTGGQRLTSYEFNRIDRVPKFIFSNACESGITPVRSELRNPALAPSFAEVFFARGVSNLVCTAWPVDDRAAREFALTLYAQLLGMQQLRGTSSPAAQAGDGQDNISRPQQERTGRIRYRALDIGSQPMYSAMQTARIGIADASRYDIRTWGAYQHYGNPYYRLFDRASLGIQPSSAEATPPEQSASDRDDGSPLRTKAAKSKKPAAQIDSEPHLNKVNDQTGENALPPMASNTVGDLVADEKAPVRK